MTVQKIDYEDVGKFRYDNIETTRKLKLLSEAIKNEIESSFYLYTNNARLNYSFCDTEEEKDEYSKKRLIKFRNKLGKCMEFSETIQDIIKQVKLYDNEENSFNYEIQYFLFDNFEEEVFEELPESHFEDYEEYLKHSTYKHSDLKKFVKYLKILKEYLKCESLVKSEYNLPKSKSNPHPRIFVDNYAYKLFERLKTTIKNPLADYSFIYRKMINDKLIYESVGDSEFRHWLSNIYEVEIDKMKQLHICSTNAKENLYLTMKEVVVH